LSITKTLLEFIGMRPTYALTGGATRAAGALALGLGVAAPAHAEWALNMPQGVTPISRDVYSLHMLIFWICVAIGIVVFGAIFWSILRHRKSRGAVASQFHESVTVEIAWTIVPFLILVAMAVPAAQTLVDMEDSAASDLTVKITGHQWLWQYEYVDEGVQFYSKMATPRRAISDRQAKQADYLLAVDNRLVLPVGKKVRFQHTSDDVIHSWWVPALSVKKDAVPGYINTNWARIDEPGVYRGKCTELCGRGHGFMPIVVEALPPDKFQAWLEEKKAASQAAAADTGEPVASAAQ
jgi:cytochrome c oxidase subunit 2